jgi:hypothetical protein
MFGSIFYLSLMIVSTLCFFLGTVLFVLYLKDVTMQAFMIFLLM